MKKFGRFFGRCPKNNDIRLRRVKVLRSESVVAPSSRKRSTRRKRALPVVSSSKQEFVFSRTCAGKRHLRSRERGDRKGANGGKREGERSEQESVVTRQKKEGVNGGENGLSEAITRCRPRQNKDSRRDGGHAPPQRHLERSERDDEREVHGEKTE